MLAILTKLDIYLLSSTSILKYHQDMWLGSSVDELLHFLMTFLNSSLENGCHSNMYFIEISSSKYKLIWWSWTELNVWWSTYQRSLSSIYGHSLNYRASMTGSLYSLIQFMRFQGFLFFNTISWISLSKDDFLIFLTKLLIFPIHY